MDLTRSAMEFLQETAKPNIVEHNGLKYSDKHVSLIPQRKYPTPLRISTLRSLVDYIKSGLDTIEEEQFFIVIEDERCINLVSALYQDEANRKMLVHVVAESPTPDFDMYKDRERFQIALQTLFQSTEDRDILLKFISSVQSGTISTLQDDGITQRATVNRGAKGKADVCVPNPVTLRPYRTFVDLEQPASPFIFRLKDSDGEVYAGIWEADGGAWRLEAVQSIKDYLKRELGDLVGDRFFILG